MANGRFAALSLALGARASASVSVEQTDGADAPCVQRAASAPVGPGLGYRVQAADWATAAGLVDGELRAQSKWGAVDVRQSVSNGQASTWAQVTGGWSPSEDA